MKRTVAVVAIWLLPASGIAADTPLLKAAEAGDLAAVNALLAKGARASEASDIGITPAYVAATNGDVAVLRRLTRCGRGGRHHGCLGRHAIDGSGARREPRRGDTAARPRRGGQRRGATVRSHRADVGRASQRHRDHAAAADARRHHRGAHARRREAGRPVARRRRRLSWRGHRPKRRAAAGRAAADARRHDAAAVRGA